MPFELKNPNADKAAALNAARKASQPSKEDAKIIAWIDPAKAQERNRIIFDDSGSMSSEIKNAVDGSIEFLRNCIQNQTSVAFHFLETKNEKLSSLNSNLPEIAVLLKEVKFNLGGTPLFGTLKAACEAEPKATRLIAFTDGSPTDAVYEGERNDWCDSGSKMSILDRWKKSADIIIAIAIENKQPIDTVFFGRSYSENEIALLKYISEKTGGYFLHFDPAKVNFKTAFKYLAPVNRLMLSSESVRKEIEDGKRS